jgi:membrane-associated phospholipid phosphatase
MNEAGGNHFAWPTLARAGLYLRLLLLLTLLFLAVYVGCNWITQYRGHSWGLYTEWELAIPFVPAMIYGYASIAFLLALPLLYLDEARMRALAKAFALVTLIAGLCFLLVPAHLAHPRPAYVAGYNAVYSMLYQADLPHNTVPSLHIAYSTLIVLAIGGMPGARRPGRTAVVLYAWLVLMCASVLLVRQHHLLDVASGLVLGWLCHRRYFGATVSK